MNGSNMTWDDIAAQYYFYTNMSCKPIGIGKVREGHIFDEDKSVKWNREEVERHNAEYQRRVAELNTERNKKFEEVVGLVVEKIQDEVGHNLSKKKGRAIWDYAYSSSKSYGFDSVLATLEELISLADILLTKEK